MSNLSTTASPSTFEGAVCFETELGCLEVHSGSSTLGNQMDIPIPQSRSLCADISLFWTTTRPLTVSFLDVCNTYSFTDEQVKGFVESSARSWTRGTSLRFRFLDVNDPKRGQANIRISFRRTESWSVLGTTFVEAEKPTMNLSFKRNVEKEEITRTVLHEFGHALGFHHEHSSPNCPLHLDRGAIMQYYRISPETFNDNFAKLAMSSNIEASCFDRYSVMMYEIWPDCNEEGKRIEGGSVLSKTDRKMVQKWYPPRTMRRSTKPSCSS